MEWKFNELNDLKNFAKFLSSELSKQGEEGLASEISCFEYNAYTTSSEYLGEFKLALGKVLIKSPATGNEDVRNDIILAIKAIDKAWKNRN